MRAPLPLSRTYLSKRKNQTIALSGHVIILRCVCRMEAIMLVRMRVTVLLILLFASLAVAGNKKKVVLPAYVLKARTVIVLIDPDAGINPKLPSPIRQPRKTSRKPSQNGA